MVVGVGVDQVGTFGSAVCSGHKLFSMDGGMPPLMKNSVEGIHDGVVATNGTGAVGASDSVVPVGVTSCGAGCTVCASVGAWSRLEDDIVHPNADADIKNGVVHVVAGGGGELEPRSAM